MRSFRDKAIKCRSSCCEVCVIDINKVGRHAFTSTVQMKPKYPAYEHCQLALVTFLTRLSKTKSIGKSVWAYVSELSYKKHTAEKLICTSEFGPCLKSRIYDLYTATDRWVEINTFCLHFMEAPLLSNFIHSQLVFLSTSLWLILKTNAQKVTGIIYSRGRPGIFFFNSTSPETLQVLFITHSQGLNKIFIKAVLCQMFTYVSLHMKHEGNVFTSRVAT